MKTAKTIFLDRLVLRNCVALLIVLLTAAPLALPATKTAANLSAIRIDNFGRINDAYYRGAQPKARDYTDLAGLGVKTVIDLTSDGREDEKGLVESAGMNFYRSANHDRPSLGCGRGQVPEAGQRSCQPAGICSLPGRPAPDRRDDRGVSHDPRWLECRTSLTPRFSNSTSKVFLAIPHSRPSSTTTTEHGPPLGSRVDAIGRRPELKRSRDRDLRGLGVSGGRAKIILTSSLP